MNRTARSVWAPRRRGHYTIILSLLVAGLVLGACDLGGAPPPTTGPRDTPTPSSQPPATLATSTGPGGGSTATTSGPNGGSTATTGGSRSGSGNTTAGDGNTPVVPGGVSAMFNLLAGGVPIQGTDPAAQPIVQMVQKVGPAVVTVVNTLDPAVTGGYGGEARGSGAIIDQAGYIITNNHVVEGQQQLFVIFSDGKKQRVDLVGTAPDRDLAVLKASGPMPAVVPLGDSDKLMPGEVVVAIGSALGEFRNTVTVGVVSGLNRSLAESQNVHIDNLIQTDAAINHGNSGGPLLNINGEVVGINTLGVTQAGEGDIAQGLGFAIPASSVKVTYAQIVKGGGRPFVGVTIRQLDARLASYYNLLDPNGNPLEQGALVTDVTAGGPAANAGIQPGDVITALDNQAITDQSPLGDVLLNYQPGQQVKLTIVRDGRQGTTTITLGKR